MRSRRLLRITWPLAVVLLMGCAAPAPVAPTPDSPVRDAPASQALPARVTEEWTKLPDGPLSARRSTAGGWLDGRFVLVGGWTDRPCPPNADCGVAEPAQRDTASFDPATGTWTTRAQAPVPVGGNNSVVVDGRLYVLTVDVFDGGTTAREDGTGRLSFLRYDPRADAWTTLQPPPDASSRLVAAGNDVIAIRNSDEWDTLADTSADAVFDTGSESWTPLPNDPLGPSYDREAVWLGNELLLMAKDLVPDPGSDSPSLVGLATLDGTFATWTPLPGLNVIGVGPVAVAGRVVFPELGFSDGGEVGTWEHPVPHGGIFTPADGGWRELPALPAGITADLRAFGGRALAVGDRALVAGHLLDPVTGEWTLLPSVSATANDGAAILAGSGSILVWGGANYDNDPLGTNVEGGYLLQFQGPQQGLPGPRATG